MTRPAARATCAVCKKLIQAGEARIRRGVASVHVECANREEEKKKKKPKS
jgi:hypothetical protein